MSSSNTTPPPPPRDGLRAYATAVAVAIVQMMMMGASASFTVYVDKLSHDPSLGRPSHTTISLLRTIGFGLSMLLGLPASAFCDKFGARPVLVTSALAFLAMALFTPMTQSLAAFFAVYASTMGIAFACLTAPGPVTISSWFTPARASVGIGIGEAGVAVGTAIVPLVIGLLVGHFDDWREAMRCVAALAAAPLVLSVFIVERPRSPDDDDEGGESDGQTDSSNHHYRAAPIQAATEDGDEQARSHHSGGDGDGDDDDDRGTAPPSQTTPQHAGDSTAAEVVVAASATLAQHLATPTFLLLFAMQFLFGASYFGVNFICQPYARALGRNGTVYSEQDTITVAKSASLLTWWGAFPGVGALAGGAFPSRWAGTRVVLAACCFASAGALALVSMAVGYVQLAALFAVCGFGFSGGMTCIPALVVESFAGPYVNRVMASSFVGFTVGGMIGMPVLTAIYEGTSPQSFAPSWIGAAGAIALVGLIALASALVPPRSHEHDVTRPTADESRLISSA